MILPRTALQRFRCFNARSTTTEPVHRADHIFRNDDRSFTPENLRRRNDDIWLRAILFHHVPLFFNCSSVNAFAYPWLFVRSHQGRPQQICAERKDIVFAMGRVSNASTFAPRRRAVAIACNPATPAPMITLSMAAMCRQVSSSWENLVLLSAAKSLQHILQDLPANSTRPFLCAVERESFPSILRNLLFRKSCKKFGFVKWIEITDLNRSFSERILLYIRLAQA